MIINFDNTKITRFKACLRRFYYCDSDSADPGGRSALRAANKNNRYGKPDLSITTLAQDCRNVIEAAEADGLTIDNDCVVDLCADNIEASLSDIRCALVVAGYGKRFLKATRERL